MSTSVGIVGAGLAGRLLALKLNEAGWDVELFDSDSREGTASCTHASAGMLAPSCEMESAEEEIATYGLTSLVLWPRVLEKLDRPVPYAKEGSLVVAHPGDADELLRLKNKVRRKTADPSTMEEVGLERIRELEPALAEHFHSGLYFSEEGHIDNRVTMEVLAETLSNRGVTWHEETPVRNVDPHEVHTESQTYRYDWIADTRGLGAKSDLGQLRGIRGELVYVHAPEVSLSRPIRMMHPRYPIYIVPRPDSVFVIGATAIESDDLSPITVRSSLELLSAAYAVHTGFAEGRLLETVVNCRPAFPDNRPRIQYADGLIRINGLYRHGFLLSPLLTDFAVEYLTAGSIHPDATPIFVAEE